MARITSQDNGVRYSVNVGDDGAPWVELVLTVAGLTTHWIMNAKDANILGQKMLQASEETGGKWDDVTQ